MGSVIHIDGWDSLTEIRAMIAKNQVPDRFVLVSSGEVFGGISLLPAHEDLPGMAWQHLSTRGIICAAAEHLLRPFSPVIIRLGAVLEDLRMPNVLKLGDEALVKFSVISQKEAVLAANLALEHGKPGEIFNIARQKEVCILELIGQLFRGRWAGPYPVLDCRKARRELGWDL